MDKDGFCWANLPPQLEEVLQESITLEGWKSAPKTVVLGRKGSYVYVNSKGDGHSHLGGQYVKLKAYLTQPSDCHGKIEFISLDSITGIHSFAVVKDKPHLYDIPSHLDATVKALATKLPEVNYQAPDTVEGLRAEYTKLNSQKDTLEAEHTGLKNQNKTLEGDHGRLKVQYETLNTNHSKLGSRNEALEDELNKLKLRHELLKAQHESLDGDHTRLKARNQTLEADSSRLQAQDQTLRAFAKLLQT